MAGGRRKLPVLAEIGGPAPGEPRAWSLRRADLEPLARLQATIEAQTVVLVEGDERLAGAAALAAAAAAGGRRTALLECDLERPRLAAELGLAPTPGLHEYLRWEATAAEILQPLVLAGPAAAAAAAPLVVIAAGRPAADLPTLVGLESFRHALAKLRRAYDLVVVAGPGGEGADGALAAVAAQADAVLAAASPAAIAGRAGRRLRSRLRKLPAPARGVLVVGAEPGS
jgi:receptor protein-tyrosine kinase